MKSSSKPYLISTLLHLSIMVFFIAFSVEQKEESSPDPRFYLDWFGVVKSKESLEGQIVKKKSLSDFYISTRPRLSVHNNTSRHLTSDDDLPKQSGVGEENGQLAHSIDKGLLSRNQGFYNHVSSRLKNNIHLPTSLASFNKTGNVNLKIKLNRQGQVVQILRSSGSNRTLVNYAILSVVAALIEPSMHQFLTSGDSEHIIDLDIHISNLAIYRWI